MLLSPFILLSFAAGIAALIFYIVMAHRSSEHEANLGLASAFFVGGTGVAVAVRLFILAVLTPEQELAPFTNEDRVFIALGAIALCWTFYEAVKNFLRSL